MPATIPCPACGTDNPQDAAQCQVCDYDLRARLPGPPSGTYDKCPRCGSRVAHGAAFCQVCGQSVSDRLARPHTGALNVRTVFGDPDMAAGRGLVRQHTAVAPAPQAPAAAVPLASPGPAPAVVEREAPRGRRRPAPRPRPNFAGFGDVSAAPAAAAAAPAPAPAASRAAAPMRAAFQPVYADAPRPGPARAPVAPRPRPEAGPAASPHAPGHPQAAAHTRPGHTPASSQPQPHAARPPQAAQTWAAPPAQVSSQPTPRLVLVGADGQEGDSHPIPASGLEIGRQAAVSFPSDPFVSPRHAHVAVVEGGVHVRDLDSRNGVYQRLVEPTPVYPGDHFLLGNQLLRLDRLEDDWREKPRDGLDVRGFGSPVKPPWAVLVRICVGEIEDDRYHLRGQEMIIGREEGDIVFPNDGFLSRQHARVQMTVADNAMTVVLEDLGSANGTYLRIRGPVVVPHGGMFRVGDQIFRVRND